MYKLKHKIFSKGGILLKIFFLSKSNVRKFIKSHIHTIILAFIITTMFVAQNVKLYKNEKSVLVNSQNITKKSYLEMTFSKNTDNLKVLINGEEYDKEIKDLKLSLCIDSHKVIEILNKSDDIIDVKISYDKDDMYVLSDKTTFSLNKGINYIALFRPKN